MPISPANIHLADSPAPVAPNTAGLSDGLGDELRVPPTTAVGVGVGLALGAGVALEVGVADADGEGDEAGLALGDWANAGLIKVSAIRVNVVNCKVSFFITELSLLQYENTCQASKM